MDKIKTRTLTLILGDQLDPDAPSRCGLTPDRDVILMAEVSEASRRPVSSRVRTAVVLSAMRHHAEVLRDAGWTVRYVGIGEPGNTQSFGGELRRAIDELSPERISCIQPGSHALAQELDEAARAAGMTLDVHPDAHFLCGLDEFEGWASGRKSLTMEYFYRWVRKKLDVLMDDGQPHGGAWNFDKENRKAFKSAPMPPPVPEFPPDDITAGVLRDIDEHLPGLPGQIERWIWPVTREDALAALDDFISNRLPFFGDFQDAMWTGEHTLYHSVISAPLNLKLLDPREVYAAAVTAYEEGRAPINAVEGFVRQIIGWREFIRGVYFHEGPGYEDRNALEQHGALPEFYWTGETDMRCMRHALCSVIDLGYGHHIARLMVTGNFALIAGIEPRAVHEWYLGMYADGIDWVTAPNTIGMALHADGGVVGTKPYAASGKYISRMGNYCKSCRYDVNARTGDDACPFNTFYWDFLQRNEARFASNTRMRMVLKNLERLSEGERVEITVSADRLRDRMGITSSEAVKPGPGF